MKQIIILAVVDEEKTEKANEIGAIGVIEDTSNEWYAKGIYLDCARVLDSCDPDDVLAIALANKIFEPLKEE